MLYYEERAVEAEMAQIPVLVISLVLSALSVLTIPIHLDIL